MSPPICAPRAVGSGRRAGAGRLPAACDRSSGACELAFSLLIYRTVRAFAAANANFSMVGAWGRVVSRGGTCPRHACWSWEIRRCCPRSPVGSEMAADSTSPGCRSPSPPLRSEEHTSELQSQSNLVCRLLLEKKKTYHRHCHLPNSRRALTPSSNTIYHVILHAPHTSHSPR